MKFRLLTVQLKIYDELNVTRTKISYFQTKYSSLMYLLLQKELSVTILQYRCKYFTVVILFSLLLKKNYINQRIPFCSVTLKEINLLLQYLDHQQDCRSTQKCLITNKMFVYTL